MRVTTPQKAIRMCDRRVLLKAAAAFSAMAAYWSSQYRYDASAEEAPETRAGKWIEEEEAADFAAAGTERTFTAEFPFTAIAPHWGADGDASAIIEFRVSADGQQWSDPIRVGEASADAGPPDRDGRHFGTLVLLDQPVTAVRYNVFDPSGNPTTLPSLAFTYLDASDGPRIEDRFTAAALSPSSGPPPVISRAAWGANERYRHIDQDPNQPIAWPPEYQLVEHVIVHHTETPTSQDPMAAIRSIYYYHAVERGWGDIGYNYLVDRFGHVYEGRYGGDNVIGGHAYEYARGSSGIAVIGSYQDQGPSADALAGLVWITAWVGRFLDPFGVAPFHAKEAFPSIAGHRDANSTACPGDALYGDLADLRAAVAEILASQPDPPSNPAFLIGNAVRTAVDGANFRSGPSLDFTVFQEVPYTTEFRVIDGPITNQGYEWYRVSGEAGLGWFASAVLESTAGGSSPRFGPGTLVEVNTDSLNLRVAPSLYAGIAAQLAAGETATVLAGPYRREERNWYWLRTTYGRGWCDGAYLTDSQPRFTIGEIVTVNTDVLRLRSAPGTGAATITSMPYGTRLKVKRSPVQADGYTWYKVNSGIYGTGWCAGQFLRSQVASSGNAFNVGDIVRVVDGSLNLRSTPSLTARVVAVLPNDARLTVKDGPVTANGFTWYAVQGAYGEGWCAGEYLRSV